MGPISAEIEIDVPREPAFELIADLAARPSFTDHFLTGFHLTRIEARGVGAGARFRVKAPLRSLWKDTTIVELEEPFRIVERGLGGRVNRIPTHTVWELTEGPGSLTMVTSTHWTEPTNPLDRVVESLSAGSIWQQRGWREALKRLRDMLEADVPAAERIAVAGGNRYATGIPNRLPPPMLREPPIVLPLLAALALAVLVRSASPPAATRATPRKWKRVSRSSSASLVHRRLLPLPEPERQRGLRLPGRPAAAAGRLDLLRRLPPGPERKHEPQKLPSTLTITDADEQSYEVMPSESLYAFPFGGEVEAKEQIPELDSTPQQGPIQGSVAIFELPAKSSANRPLMLHIPGAPAKTAKSSSTSSPVARRPRRGRPRGPRRPPARRLRRPRLRLRSAARRSPASPFRPWRRRRTRRP